MGTQVDDDVLLDQNFVTELLESWGVSKDTQAVFREHDLDIFCIENITESDINELIPKQRFKDRIKFKTGIARFKNENKTLSTCSMDTESLGSNESFKSDSSCASSRTDVPYQELHVDLQTILKTTNIGQICLQSIHKKLDTTLRNNLSKTIVDYFIKERGSMVAQDYDDISNQIVKLFPSENKEIYYIPSRKYGRKSYIPARGKLVDRYHNQRRLLRKSGLVEKKNIAQKSPLLRNIVEEPQTELKNEEEESIKLFLKFNREPWPEITEKWKLTQRLRGQDLSAKDKSIQDIISEWPSLKASLGYKLIESDFDVMHPNCELKLFQKWPLFMEKCMPVLRNIKSCEDTLKLLDDNPVEDVRDYVYLKLMSAKMPPTIKVPVKGEGKKKTFYKPSIAESEKAFILHVTNQSEILTKTRLRQEEHLGKGLTCQPLIVVVGPSVKEITDFYVLFETVLYKIDTLLKAVDVCFKIIHVFNVEYPIEAINVWTFIQKYFYEIDCKTDRKISSVACFISDLS